MTSTMPLKVARIYCHFQKVTARNIRSRLHYLPGLLFTGTFHVQNGVEQCH